MPLTSAQLGEFAHWVHPPRDLPTLLDKLLHILHETFEGDEDDFYDALDKDGDERLSKMELVNRLASHQLVPFASSHAASGDGVGVGGNGDGGGGDGGAGGGGDGDSSAGGEGEASQQTEAM